MNKTYHAISLIPKLMVLALFSLLISCGGGSEGPASTTPETVRPIAPGKLLLVNTSTIQTENGMMTMATNPWNNDIYIATLSEDSSRDLPYSLYSTILIMRPDNVTGLLTQVWMVYKVQGLQWVTQIQVDPAGKYVYFYGRTNGGSGVAISVYDVDSDGMLFYKSTVPLGAGNIFNCCFETMTGITLTPDGRYIYNYYPVNSSDGFSESVTVYGVDQDAKITLLDSVALPYKRNGGSSLSVLHTLVASNQYLYVAHMDGSGISTYGNQNGKLTLVSDGMNVSTNSRALAMALEPSGKFLYAATVVNNNIKLYVHSIVENGTLEIVNIVDGINGGGTPFDMMVDSSNYYLYLLQSDGIAMYRIGVPGASLIPLGMQPTYINRSVGVESPGFFSMDTAGKYLYTLGLTDKPILSTYQVTQPTPQIEERLFFDRTPDGMNWKSINDTNGLTKNCNLSDACTLQFSGNIQSTKVHLIADDAINSGISFKLNTSVNNAGFDVLNVSECSVSGNLSNSVCSNINIDPSTPWIVNIPAP